MKHPDYAYEHLQRVGYDCHYDGIAQFVPVCPKCGRYVKADAKLTTDISGPVGTNATCSKCGRVTMPFEGYFDHADYGMAEP